MFAHLGALLGSASAALTTFSFVSAFVFARYTVQRCPSGAYWLLLLNPLLVDFFVSQQRQSLAFAILLLTLPSRNVALKSVAIAVTSTVHFSFVLIGPFLAFGESAYRRLLGDFNVVRVTLALAAGLVVYKYFFADSFLSVYVFARDDDTRVSGDYTHLVTSWKYSLIWVVYLVAAWLSGKPFATQRHSLAAVFLIASFVVLNFSGLSGIRLLSIAYPFFVISLQHMPVSYRVAMGGTFSLYLFVYWLYWTQLLQTTI
jgi:hypothetical protein